MLKAKLLDKKPSISTKIISEKSKKDITIQGINLAIDALDLKYKKIDELDIYNIFTYLKETHKG